MSEPVFLKLEQILELHKRSITAHGGTLGIRDQNGLESAVHHPKACSIIREGIYLISQQPTRFTLRRGNAFSTGTRGRLQALP